MSYHINSVGDPNWCIAEDGACRIHPPEAHFPTAEMARRSISRRTTSMERARKRLAGRWVDRIAAHVVWP